jgi:hypothetical protein
MGHKEGPDCRCPSGSKIPVKNYCQITVKEIRFLNRISLVFLLSQDFSSGETRIRTGDTMIFNPSVDILLRPIQSDNSA